MSLLRKLTEQFIKFLDILNMDAAMEDIKLAKETIITVIRFLISPLILTVNTVSGQSNQFSEYDLGPPTME